MNKNFDYKKSGVDLEKSDEIKSKLIEMVRSTHRDEVITVSYTHLTLPTNREV